MAGLVRGARLLLGAIVIAVTLAGAAHPKTTEQAGSGSLTGKLLVATAQTGDPRFAHTVILLIEDGKAGALGIIVNRPLEERSWASILAAIGEKGVKASGKLRIFAGGPVAPELGFVIHGAAYRRPGTIPIDAHLSVSASRQVLVDMARGKGPRQALVAFGYAGWGPGQLEREIALNAWFTEPEDPKLIFDLDRDRVWDEATARRPLAL